MTTADILIPGAELKATKIDFTNPKVKQQLSEVKTEINRVLQGQKIDMEKLRNTYITI